MLFFCLSFRYAGASPRSYFQWARPAMALTTRFRFRSFRKFWLGESCIAAGGWLCILCTVHGFALVQGAAHHSISFVHHQGGSFL